MIAFEENPFLVDVFQMFDEGVFEMGFEWAIATLEFLGLVFLVDGSDVFVHRILLEGRIVALVASEVYDLEMHGSDMTVEMSPLVRGKMTVVTLKKDHFLVHFQVRSQFLLLDGLKIAFVALDHVPGPDVSVQSVPGDGGKTAMAALEVADFVVDDLDVLLESEGRGSHIIALVSVARELKDLFVLLSLVTPYLDDAVGGKGTRVANEQHFGIHHQKKSILSALDAARFE